MKYSFNFCHGSRTVAFSTSTIFVEAGRSPDWLKMKNSDAPAVKREAEEDWHR
jgi:hypothetical protein